MVRRVSARSVPLLARKAHGIPYSRKPCVLGNMLFRAIRMRTISLLIVATWSLVGVPDCKSKSRILLSNYYVAYTISTAMQRLQEIVAALNIKADFFLGICSCILKISISRIRMASKTEPCPEWLFQRIFRNKTKFKRLTHSKKSKRLFFVERHWTSACFVYGESNFVHA